MIQEFKDFITRGNLVTLAVGFIMGVAFSAIVSSFVEDIVMPIIAIPFGQPDFTHLTLEVNGSVIAWGSFLTAAVVFLLTALAVFLFIVKPYNAFEQRMAAEADDESEAEVASGPSEIDLLVEIRDALSR
ncbi:MAG: large conductance mechanosensitive channel protein MscL [Acidimicrobiia bacterium]|nr:large conductance mechanosensitive channel protein MscL [Acidimicrobiia bacterium]